MLVSTYQDNHDINVRNETWPLSIPRTRCMLQQHKPIAVPKTPSLPQKFMRLTSLKSETASPLYYAEGACIALPHGVSQYHRVQSFEVGISSAYEWFVFHFICIRISPCLNVNPHYLPALVLSVTGLPTPSRCCRPSGHLRRG